MTKKTKGDGRMKKLVSEIVMGFIAFALCVLGLYILIFKGFLAFVVCLIIAAPVIKVLNRLVFLWKISRK
jgi:hypothetical protein